jgi:hypothetical protein
VQGWLTIRDDGISFPKFDRHNGASAKKRALTRDRNKNLRARQGETKHEPAERTPRRNRDAQSVTQASLEQEQEQEGKEGRAPGSKNGSPNTSPGFKRFWSTWPTNNRKRNRKGCWTIWNKDGLEALVDTIVAAVEDEKASRDWTKQQGDFIPEPIRWLKEARWEQFVERQQSAPSPELHQNFMVRT